MEASKPDKAALEGEEKGEEGAVEKAKVAAVRLAPAMLIAMRRLVAVLELLNEEIAALDAAIGEAFKSNELAKRLAGIPGVGVLIASLIANLYPDPRVFSGAREFAAYLGLVPRQRSTGGKTRLGHISKMGNRNVRSLLFQGATAVLWRLRDGKANSALAVWARKLLAKKPFRLVAVALANKIARTIWGVMARGESYEPNFKPAMRPARAAA